ncbi:hypothetical protein [Marinobacter oulmenensis]|uniref:Transcriptional regulator GlxA family with amidase domain n=1 Tax=Marinobacter oulmenensis TaxID=643747 RepID=A0A840UFB1_9GAMM|nr:hypothetical protein [Marinobacter oulmenensis]MBB5322873.1 transcriptional regulator GlxA family with amidase domain [Marinobacter oulmenensis]
MSKRLRHGRELLESTSLSVEAIAEKIGSTRPRRSGSTSSSVTMGPRDWRKTFGEEA